jgi:diguanylate cyclase (GGDEF)-like protein
MRILVVDDDADSREALAMRIARSGHSCTTAGDGDEAWAMQQTQPADVILCDWRMPRMTGIELCRLVRSSASPAYTYFIFMTGFNDKAHFIEGLRAGADDYVTKPVDSEELEARLLSAARVIAMQRALVLRNVALRNERDASFDAARVDALTQSANRLQLREDLDALQSRASRYGHHYCAALVDLDLFKGYNDTYGHLPGDAALRLVADAMGAALRKGDTLYRYGGEEFLIILPEQPIHEAVGVLTRVRESVEALAIPYLLSKAGVLTISVGIAELGWAGGTCDDWLRRADAALYRAKHLGRNRVEIDETPVDGAA